MNLSQVDKRMRELGDIITKLDIERDGILHRDGNKIRDYYDFQKVMYCKIYPVKNGEEHIPQNPSEYFHSHKINDDYYRLFNLQMSSAPIRLKLADIKRASIGYQNERKQLFKLRQELAGKKQQQLDF